MKEFSCGAVVPDCDAKFTAESEDEILTQVADHARSVHGMDEVPPRSSTRCGSTFARPHKRDAYLASSATRRSTRTMPR